MKRKFNLSLDRETIKTFKIMAINKNKNCSQLVEHWIKNEDK